MTNTRRGRLTSWSHWHTQTPRCSDYVLITVAPGNRSAARQTAEHLCQIEPGCPPVHLVLEAVRRSAQPLPGHFDCAYRGLRAAHPYRCVPERPPTRSAQNMHCQPAMGRPPFDVSAGSRSGCVPESRAQDGRRLAQVGMGGPYLKMHVQLRVRTHGARLQRSSSTRRAMTLRSAPVRPQHQVATPGFWSSYFFEVESFRLRSTRSRVVQ